MSASHFDTFNAHLQTRGSGVLMERAGDLDVIVRRCAYVHALGDEYGEVELSPYMHTLLGVTRERERRIAMERKEVIA